MCSKICTNVLSRRLAPFLFAVVLFFFSRNLLKDNLVLYALLKCSPILSLYWFAQTVQFQVFDKTKIVSLKYLNIGLIFSCIGDILLVWPATFLYGIGAFALAHVMYIGYFEMNPRNNALGAVLVVMNLIVFLVVSSTISGILLMAVLIYSHLLIGTVWRSLDQALHCKDKKIWSVCGAVGSLLFCFSDLMIAVTMFLHPIPYSEVLIMSTYYAGQLGIALSTLRY
ncbi:lysoplasmalogenase TMEM86B [Planococcus citri]|uniref:lysoplasmalogenase TMEM86B n=1 Tax=Planococcus citri TaxID=170843 RepID=UPI0031F80AAF